MRKDLKLTFSRSSNGNLFRVVMGVVLQEQYTASQCSVPFLRFPGVAASIRLHDMHCLSCDLAQDNQS